MTWRALSVRGWGVAVGALVLVAVGVALLLRGALADAAKVERSTARLKACSAPTSLFSPGPAFDGLKLTAVRRVCSAPHPMVSESAGGIDPDSLGRGNYTSFLYGDCTPVGDTGCPFPLEVQVWPTCERNPATYVKTQARAKADNRSPDDATGPQLLAKTTVRKAPVYIFGPTQTSAADRTAERVEAIVGDSTVVVFSSVGDNAPTGKAAEVLGLSRMLKAIRELRPSGTSNSPNARRAAAASSALPAPAAGVLTGKRDCRS